MSCHRAFLPRSTMLFVNTTSLILGEAVTITLCTLPNNETEPLRESEWANLMCGYLMAGWWTNSWFYLS